MVKLNELDDVDVNTGSRETPDDGDYNMMIEESKYGQTKNGKGTGYAQKLTMLDGPYSGTTVFNYINVSNPNDTAQAIGRSVLKTIMTITGIEDSDDMEGKVIRARLIGEMQDYVKRDGSKTKIVNLRPTIFMSTDGKNAKGEAVPEFQPRTDNAKAQLAEWRDKNLTPHTGGGSSTSSDTSSNSGGSSDGDDEIPF